MNRRNLLARFLLAGALVGTLVGIGEGVLLYTVPRNRVLLEPEVGPPVLFIAPLVCLVVFAAVGGGLAAMACLGRPPSPTRIAVLEAVGLAVVGVYGVAFVSLIQVWRVTSRTVVLEPRTWATFALILLSLFLMVRRRGLPAGHSLAALSPRRIRHITLFVAVAAGGCLLSLGYILASRGSGPVSAHAAAAAQSSPPNLVLITLDTVRADHLSVYGYHRPTSPNLERWAEQGVRFENAIAPSSWTLPSHASMFTGLLPHQHGANYFAPIEGRLSTLAEVMHARGYETAGFSSNLGAGYAGWGMGQGFEHYVDDSASFRHAAARTLAGATVVQTAYRRLLRDDHFDRRNAEELNRDVRRWYARRSDRPFFLFINYYDAHDPYFAPPPYDGRFGRLSNADLKEVNRARSLRPAAALSSDTRARLEAGYDNCLAYLDEHVGRLLDFLAASPQWSNTIVVITSDHGEAFGEHGALTHGTNLYREVIHVPLIIFGPGIPRELRIGAITRLEELFPTFLDFASRGALPFQQATLRRYWTPGFVPGSLDGLTVAELGTASYRPAPISLVTSEWHLIRDNAGRVELYDWRLDPLEKSDLAGLPEHQTLIWNLEAKLHDYITASVQPWRGPEYLFPLSRDKMSLFGLVSRYPSVHEALPVHARPGSSQAYFAPATQLNNRPIPLDEELVKSLPYN